MGGRGGGVVGWQPASYMTRCSLHCPQTDSVGGVGDTHSHKQYIPLTHVAGSVLVFRAAAAPSNTIHVLVALG